MSRAFDTSADITDRSGSKFTASWSGVTIEYSGKGFKYDHTEHHTPKAGTISSIKVMVGSTEMTFTELKSNVATIRPLYATNDFNDLHTIVKHLLGGNDVISASQAADVIESFAGKDFITGNGGDDHLIGGKGADTIDGGIGADTLTGGAGADHFVFNSALGSSNQDTITDFNVAKDSFELAASIFTNIGTAGHGLAASAFMVYGPGSQLDASDRILYVKASGDLYYDPDGSGAMGAVKFAHLENAPNLTYHDFMIV
jgi:Ca2+-binding RTX toxin-like protein